MKTSTRFLFLDQYGNRFFAGSRKELCGQVTGRVSIMYRDTRQGTKRVGYVIGQHWLTQYAPVETGVGGAA